MNKNYTGTVESIVPKSNSLEDLQEYLATLCSVVRDKEPKSAEKLWNRLLTESCGNKASRCFEYIPCTILSNEVIGGGYDGETYTVTTQLFGFFDTGNMSKQHTTYYTNMRELLNWGWSIEECLEVVDFTSYKAFKCMAPYFIYGQVSTHTQLTTISHSQRYGTCDRGYWMPPEVRPHGGTDRKDWWNEQVESLSARRLKIIMKECGIVRKEVWDRGSDMLQNRVFSIGGYTNNPNAWEHFLDQRLDKHTQLETRDFVKMLSEEIVTVRNLHGIVGE